MKIENISFSVERVINTGNYESVRIRAEMGGSTEDVKSDMKLLKKAVYKCIDAESDVVLEKYGNDK
jgi:hypothetical protein